MDIKQSYRNGHFCSNWKQSTGYLSADTGVLVNAPILFNIVETDGSDSSIYDKTTGTFTSPVSAWYDIDVQLLATLTSLYVVKNGDIVFPIIGIVPPVGLALSHLKGRVKLAMGETLVVYASGTVNANTGLVPNAHVSNTIFTMVKRFDDTKTF